MPPRPGKVIDRDLGWKRIKADLNKAQAGQSFVVVGLLGKAHNRRDSDPVTNVEIGVIHEYGAPNAGIPERSWMRRTFDLKRDEYVKLIGKLYDGVLRGKLDLEHALELLGAKYSAEVKNTVTRGAPIPPPNAPATAKRKAEKSSGARGPMRTLIDSARMIGSVSWQVTVGGQEKPERIDQKKGGGK